MRWRHRHQPEPTLRAVFAGWVAARQQHFFPGGWWIPFLEAVLGVADLAWQDYLLLHEHGTVITFAWFDTRTQAETAAWELGLGRHSITNVADEEEVFAAIHVGVAECLQSHLFPEAWFHITQNADHPMKGATRTMRHRRPLLAVLGLATVLVPLAAVAAADPVTNYPAYPASVLPAGCDEADITASRITLNGVESPLGLRPLGDLHPGDVIVWSFSSVLPSPTPCVEATLAFKQAPGPQFEIDKNQQLVGWDTVPVAAGRAELTIPAGVCFAQLDAVVGPPLNVVGPDGSYYSHISRGDNGADALVDAWNGSVTPCQPSPATTTTTASTTSSTSSPPTGPTSTTSPPVSTTAAPSTSQPTATTAAPTTSAPPPTSSTTTTAEPPASTTSTTVTVGTPSTTSPSTTSTPSSTSTPPSATSPTPSAPSSNDVETSSLGPVHRESFANTGRDVALAGLIAAALILLGGGIVWTTWPQSRHPRYRR